MFGQEYFTKCATSQGWQHIKTRKSYLTIIGNLIKLIGQLFLLHGFLTRTALFVSCFNQILVVLVVLGVFISVIFMRSLAFSLLVLWTDVFAISGILLISIVAVYSGNWSAVGITVVYWVVTVTRYCTVPTPDTHVENVLFYLLWCCLYLLLNVLNNQLISLYLWDQLRVFLQLLGELDC